MGINWDSSKEDDAIIEKIAARAVAIAQQHDIDYGQIEAEMDITACHLNSVPLRLQALLDADDFDFAHDAFGIRRHIDRTTGELGDCFLPRFANLEAEAAQ